MTKATPTGLSVRNLSTGYGDLTVVWDVSFEVRPGQVTALLGKNGAGKTSALRAVAGLNKCFKGSVTLHGRDVTSAGPAHRVRSGLAYVQEGKRVFHKQTVEQNLLLGGYSRKMSRRHLTSEIEEIYELFPILADRRTMLAGAMSGGQQQMLAIGQALMAKPTVLMLDEPSGGLAPVIVNEVMERVEAMKQAGMAILLVEQAVEVAMSVADSVCVLDVGRAVLEGEADRFESADLVQAAYLGKAPDPEG